MGKPRPPFCPNSECRAHYEPPGERWWVCRGTYSSQLHPRVQRFGCRLCGCGFSSQTFDIDYYAKRRVSYPKLAKLVSSCCGIRQIARYLGVGYETVSNRIMRFSRQVIAMQLQVLESHGVEEDLCSDGLQSYWVSQYVPSNITVLAGTQSRFIYAAVGTSLRRSGRMTEAQKRRREELESRYRADPNGLSHGFTEICDAFCRLVEHSDRSVTVLDTDRHLAYTAALRSHGPWHLLQREGQVVHRRTDSRVARTATNPLAAVNSLDRQIRIDLAEHVRETVRFARNPNRSMERFWVWCYTYNYCKRYRINQPVAETTRHYQAAAIDEQALRVARRGIWRKRRFMSRLRPTGSMMALWMRMIERPFRSTNDYLPNYIAA